MITREQLDAALKVFNLADVTVSDEDLRKIYRQLAKQVHPDTGGSDKAFQRLNRANEILKEAITTGKTINSFNTYNTYNTYNNYNGNTKSRKRKAPVVTVSFGDGEPLESKVTKTPYGFECQLKYYRGVKVKVGKNDTIALTQQVDFTIGDVTIKFI